MVREDSKDKTQCFWPKRRINAWKLCASRGRVTGAKEPRKEPEHGDAGGKEE